MNGIQILRCQDSSNNAILEDMTPDSQDAGHDASLLINRTLSDWEAGVHITPLDKGGTQPESIDVLINLGDFSENQQPQLTIHTAETTTTLNATSNFTAKASDPDGDTLYYDWDFGDGGFHDTGPSVDRMWRTVRDHIVRCTVSDGKGGTASASLVVKVNYSSKDIRQAPRFQVKGRVLCDGAPLQDVLVQAGSRSALTDSDGTYNLVNLLPARYPIKARKWGYRFDLDNPPIVLPGPDVKDINFEATALERERPHTRIAKPIPPTIVSAFREIRGTTWDNSNGSGVARVEVLISEGRYVLERNRVERETQTLASLVSRQPMELHH